VGLFGLILLVVFILALIGLGWKTFSSGVIAGLEKAVNSGIPVIKNLTQEDRQYVNSAQQPSTAG
jgi:hypothetical protein